MVDKRVFKEFIRLLRIIVGISFMIVWAVIGFMDFVVQTTINWNNDLFMLVISYLIILIGLSGIYLMLKIFVEAVREGW